MWAQWVPLPAATLAKALVVLALYAIWHLLVYEHFSLITGTGTSVSLKWQGLCSKCNGAFVICRKKNPRSSAIV